MKTKFLFIALVALSFASCNFNVKEMASQAKEEYKAQHEYRDSKKWGKVVSKDIDVEPFTSIIVNGSVDIVFTQSDTLSMNAYGNEKAISQYDFDVKNGTFCISLKDFDEKKSVSKNTPAITIFVKAPEIDKLETYGAGDIKFCNHLKQSAGLDIDLSGAGDIDAKDLNLANLSVTINGAGDLNIEKAECSGNADFTINGAGDIEAELKCANAQLTINGAGDANLKVKCNELTATCNGAGDIKLKGECNTLHKSDGAVSSIDSRYLKVNKKIKLGE